MSLARMAVRKWFRERLQNRTDAGTRIGSNRAEAYWSEDEVGMSVYTLDEDLEIQNDTPRMYNRVLEVAVELYVPGEPAEDPEGLGVEHSDRVDRICWQVECAIDPFLPQLAKCRDECDEELCVNPSKSRLRRVETEFDEKGRELQGSARLIWEIVYGTDVDEEEAAQASSLRRVGVEFRTGGQAAGSLSLEPPAP